MSELGHVLSVSPAAIISIAAIIGFLPLSGYLAGWYTVTRNYREISLGQREDREDRKFLLSENNRQASEILELKVRVLELETQLKSALSEIAVLSSSLSK